MPTTIIAIANSKSEHYPVTFPGSRAIKFKAMQIRAFVRAILVRAAQVHSSNPVPRYSKIETRFSSFIVLESPIGTKGLKSMLKKLLETMDLAQLALPCTSPACGFVETRTVKRFLGKFLSKFLRKLKR